MFHMKVSRSISKLLIGQLVEIHISLSVPEEEKNMTTVLKLNMAEACVQDIDSDWDSSSFENDNYNDD